uniref:Uncharacterized protein n=1 Tax=Oryza meridionalis TaxID=40149 RepID=A0A0E0CZG2_9ORYZ
MGTSHCNPILLSEEHNDDSNHQECRGKRGAHILLFLTGPSSLALVLSSCFLIFPVAVLGSGPNTTDLGTQYPGILSLQNRMMSPATAASSELSAPSLSVTNAHGDSPHCSSALATTDASSTAGCAYSAFSTSRLLMFSPPEMMMSFIRSFTSMYPSGCFTPRSPEWYHPPANASAFALGFFSAPYLTPCRQCSRDRSSSGSLSHSGFHAHTVDGPYVSDSPYVWVTRKPRTDSAASSDGVGAAPATMMLTTCGSGRKVSLAGALMRLLKTTGAAHIH